MQNKEHSWEITHLSVIAGAIIILTLVIRLVGTPLIEVPLPKSAPPMTFENRFQPIPPPTPQPAPPSSPHEVTVGATGISNRYTLVSVDRKRGELVVKLHIQSLAMENLVSPFASDMLEIRSPGLQPIAPSTRFRAPIPSGNSRDQDIVFKVPPALNLDHTTLRIFYYNYEGMIPLDLHRK